MLYIVFGIIFIGVILGLAASDDSGYRKRLKEHVNEHFDILNKKYSKITKKDDYGALDLTDWWKELEVFVKNVVFKDKVYSDRDIIEAKNIVHQYFIEQRDNLKK